MIEVYRFRHPEVRSNRQLLRDARNLIETHLPEVLPTEPTEVITRRGEYDGWYEGKLRGRHYVALYKNGWNSPVRDTLTLAHELTHQWHAELMGQSDWFGDALRKFQGDVRDLDEVKRFLSSYKRGSTNITLSDTLSEGLASHAELYICQQEIKTAQQEGDRFREKEHLAIEREIFKRFHPASQCGRDVTDGRLLFQKLFRTYDLGEITDFIGRLDHKRLNNITEDSRTYNRVIERPSLLFKYTY